MPIMVSADVVDEAERRAYNYLSTRKTLSCSQTVLLTIQEVFGVRDDLMVKAVGPLAGGSRIYSLCGALIGGAIALGMFFGSEKLDDFDALVKSYEPIKDYYRRFEREFGSRYCIAIIGYDLNNPNERQRWLDSGGWEKCSRLCGKAARMVAEIIVSRKQA